MSYVKEEVIELRQIDSKTVINNGDWVNIIENNNLVINPNDRLTLKKAVIDSSNTAQNEVILDEDVNCEISFVSYITNFMENPKDPASANNATVWDRTIAGSNANVLQPDCKNYFLYDIHTGIPNNALRLLTVIEFRVNPLILTGHWGGFSVNFGYQDPAGNQKTFTLQIPRQRCHDTRRATVNVNILMLNNTLQRKDDQAYYNKHNTSDEFNPTFVADNTNSQNTLKESLINFTIPAGIYTCNELSTFVNESVDKVYSGFQAINNARFSDSPLLLLHGNFNGATNQYITQDLTNNARFLAGVNGNFYIGSGSFLLAYDDEKFKISSIHMPYYTNLGGNNNNGSIGVVHKRQGTTGFSMNIVNKGGGIALTSMSPSSFWNDVLGFDGSQCVSISRGVFNGIPTDQITTHIDGINSTGAVINCDTAIKKTGFGNNEAFNKEPNVADMETIQDGVIEIYAQNPFYTQMVKQYGGYFLLEVRLGVKTLFEGEHKQLKSIFGILTNYYRSENYLIANSDDGILYQHPPASEPLQINDISCRILTPQGQVVDNLDTDNTIFLSLMKEVLPDIQNMKLDKKKSKSK